MSDKFDDELTESADRGTALIDEMPEDEGSGEGDRREIGDDPDEPAEPVKKAKAVKKAAPKKAEPTPKKSAPKVPAKNPAKPAKSSASKPAAGEVIPKLPAGAGIVGKPAVSRKTIGSGIKPGKYHTKELKSISERLKQVADWCRIGVVMLLSEVEECSVTDIVEHFSMSQPAVSHHLALMRHGRLIECRRDGKFNRYALTDAGKTIAATCKTLMVD